MGRDFNNPAVIVDDEPPVRDAPVLRQVAVPPAEVQHPAAAARAVERQRVQILRHFFGGCLICSFSQVLGSLRSAVVLSMNLPEPESRRTVVDFAMSFSFFR